MIGDLADGSRQVTEPDRLSPLIPQRHGHASLSAGGRAPNDRYGARPCYGSGAG
jgi:hypothetical protein